MNITLKGKRAYLQLDGQVVAQATVPSSSTGQMKFVAIYPQIDRLHRQRFSDIPESLQILNFPKRKCGTTLKLGIALNRSPDEHLAVKLRLWSIVERENPIFDLARYLTQLRSLLSLDELSWQVRHDVPQQRRRQPVATCVIKITNERGTIGEMLEPVFNRIANIDQTALRSILLGDDSNSVSAFFEFPEEVRVPCEQYLQYFAEFLKDLGVKANTSLVQQAGKVLFTITPTDQEQALDNIRQALDAYLQLPSSPIGDVAQDFALLKLERQISNLKGELKLTVAELKLKEKTIQTQELMIEVQKGLLNGELFAPQSTLQPKQLGTNQDSREDVIPGYLRASKFSKFGFDLEVGEIVRQLKVLFASKRDTESEKG